MNCSAFPCQPGVQECLIYIPPNGGTWQWVCIYRVCVSQSSVVIFEITRLNHTKEWKINHNFTHLPGNIDPAATLHKKHRVCNVFGWYRNSLGNFQTGKILAVEADKLTILTRLSALLLAHSLTEQTEFCVVL